MKKVLIGLFTATIVLSAGITGALAAGPGSGCGRNFVDTDENGICDFAGKFCRYAAVDRDGVYRNHCSCGNGSENCFVDSDGDGICDNHLSQGTGQGHGPRGRCNR